MKTSSCQSLESGFCTEDRRSVIEGKCIQVIPRSHQPKHLCPLRVKGQTRSEHLALKTSWSTTTFRGFGVWVATNVTACNTVHISGRPDNP